MAKTKKQYRTNRKQLWKAVNKLRRNIDGAEYKHVVLGLIFLKYTSHAFEELYAGLEAERDLPPDLKAGHGLANPAFNDSDWGGEPLKDEKRWKYGIKPVAKTYTQRTVALGGWK